MGASRETLNVWWYLFGFYENYGGSGKKKWRGYTLFHRYFWRGRFWGKDCSIWHDSVGGYWNKWVTCRLHGHVHTTEIPEEDRRYSEGKDSYCFTCNSLFNK